MPGFWYSPFPTLTARLLQPLSWAYQAIFFINQTLKICHTYHANIPIISVGNITVGGAGKTPVVEWLADYFSQQGYAVAIISRGYRGKDTAMPIRVDAEYHTADQVGDEPLMLARRFAGKTDKRIAQAVSIWVCKHRPSAVRRAEQAGATLILLDDGFQRLDVARTVNILVIDGRKGLASAYGNGLTLPAGPLREPLTNRQRASFAIVLNETESIYQTYYGLPAYRLFTRFSPEALAPLKNSQPIAFAGIAQPEKFFSALTKEGIFPKKCLPFPDHYAYSEADIYKLAVLSMKEKSPLVTTSKDAIKIQGNKLPSLHVLPLTVYGEDQSAILSELTKLINN